MSAVTARSIDGRPMLDRAGVAERTGVAYTTVAHWHRHRTRFGFPDGIVVDGTRWFFTDDIDAFHTAHQAAQLAGLTAVDKRGDPEELVTSGQVAEILDYNSYRNLPAKLYQHPDHTEDLPDGRKRKFWHRRTVWAHADARTGGRSTGRTRGSATGPRKAHPYADDPRLPAALDLLRQADAAGEDRRGLGRVLAEQLGIPARTAQRLIAIAAEQTPT